MILTSSDIIDFSNDIIIDDYLICNSPELTLDNSSFTFEEIEINDTDLSSDSRWYLSVINSAIVNGGSVSWCDASGGIEILALTTTDLDNNINWIFSLVETGAKLCFDLSFANRVSIDTDIRTRVICDMDTAPRIDWIIESQPRIDLKTIIKKRITTTTEIKKC